MGYLSNPAWKKLIGVVANSLSDSMQYAELYHVDKNRAEKAIRNFTSLKDLAALGNISARQSIVEYYIRILEAQDQHVLSTTLKDAVDFTSVEGNEESVIFELLIANYTFENIMERCKQHRKSSSTIDGDCLKEVAADFSNTDHFLQRYEKKRERMYFICTLLYAVCYGQGCIESLQYKDIDEIGVLNKEYIYVVFKGTKIRLKFLSFENTSTIINIQKKTTQNSALNYDMQNPIIVTSKNNSSRISAAGYDVTPGDNDFYYNERIFNLNAVSLETMDKQYHTINDSMVSFFRYNQKGRGSFIVSGSDMGVGKSTFLLSMIGEYPDYWGIGILDQQNELQAGIKYPDKNVITLVENAKRNLAQSFAYLLKTSRDVLVVSEITLPDEVSELVNAALRLNAGVSATMHSHSPKEVIPNLRNMMMKTPMYNDKCTAEEDIASSLDLIIHLRRLTSGRIVVDSVYEVYSDDAWKNQILNPQFDYEYETGTGEKGHILEQMLMKLGIAYLRGLILGKQYTLRPIFQFREELAGEGDWQISSSPSERYFHKMSRYNGEEKTRQMKALFQKQEGLQK